jgi:diamine N-acetyltransferase
MLILRIVNRSGNINIRKATLADAELITRLSSETFHETFALLNTEEDMKKYLAEKFNLEAVSKELEDSKTMFYLAFSDEESAGYTKLRSNQHPASLKADKAMEVERLYVRKKFQKQKIGAALMQKGIEHAKENGCDVIWLGVWENNISSIEFYKRWGFETFGSHIFRLGTDDQTDLLMKKDLK